MATVHGGVYTRNRCNQSMKGIKCIRSIQGVHWCGMRTGRCIGCCHRLAPTWCFMMAGLRTPRSAGGYDDRRMGGWGLLLRTDLGAREESMMVRLWDECGVHIYDPESLPETQVYRGAEIVWARGGWRAWWLPIAGRSGELPGGPFATEVAARTAIDTAHAPGWQLV